MRVEKILNPDTGQLVDNYIFEDGEHAVMTGPIQGVITLDDGTAVNVSQPFVAVDTPEQAAELAEKIGLHYAENGHPDDVDMVEDPETGKTVVVERPFNYTAPDGTVTEGSTGTALGEHPLDVQPDEVAPAATDTTKEK